MNKYSIALDRGAVIIPKLLNVKFITMDISDYSQFRPAIQSKDFDRDRKEFEAQCHEFFEFVRKAIDEDRVFKLSRKNPAAPLVMLPDDSPVHAELKDNFAEVTFIVKL
jgi:hypothetical protein